MAGTVSDGADPKAPTGLFHDHHPVCWKMEFLRKAKLLPKRDPRRGRAAKELRSAPVKQKE